MAVRNSFNEAKDAVAALEWNAEAPEKYAEAISGLSRAQQELIYSADKLSDKNKALVEGILDNMRDVKIAAAEEAAGLDKDTLSAVLNRKSIDNLSEANIRLKLFVAESKHEIEKLTEEQKKQIITAMTGKTANEKLSFSFATLKANALAAVQAMIVNPFFWVSAAITSISLLIRGIEEVKRKHEEALQTSVSEYKELTDEIANLESELKSVGDRIKELSGLGAPTVSDQEELDRLLKTNEELERELRIKKALQKQAAVESEDNAKKWLGDQTFWTEYDPLGDFGSKRENLDWNVAADRLMSSVERYRGKLEEAKAAMDAASGDVTSSAFKSAKRQAESAQEEIDDALKELADIYTNIKGNVIDSIGDQADTEWGEQILALWDSFEKAYDKLLSDGNKIEIPEVDAVGAAASVETYTAKLSELTDVISSTKSAYDALKSAQDDMDSGAGISTDTVEKLAKENENYLDYLYEENGIIKLNTEAWKENADAKMENEISEIQKEIDSLNERNRILLESIEYYERMKDTDSNAGMWDQEIAKVRVEIEKNNSVIDENQEKMRLYELLFKQIQSDSDDAFSSITEHLTFITGQYDLLTKAQDEFSKSGILSASTLSSIVDKFPEMENSVSLYIAGLKTGNELLADLSNAYNTDVTNYQNALKAKLSADSNYYNSLTKNQKKLIDEVGKSYGVDLKNFQTVEQKKLAIQAEIVKRLAANYSQYSGATLNDLKKQYSALASKADSSAAFQKERDALGATISSIESAYKKIEGIAFGEGLISSWSPSKFTPSKSSSSGSSSKDVEKYIADIDKYREAIERLRQVQEDRSEIERKIKGTDDFKDQIALQKQLINVYQQEQSALHNLNDQRDATISAGAQSLRELGFAVQYNADTNELWISNMEHLNELTAKSKGKYASLQEATNALRKDTEELIGTITDLNEENREGSSSWFDLKDSIREAKIAIVNDLKEIVDQAHNIVDEIQNVSDTLYEAADEFASNDGFITVDTYQALLRLGPQYMQMLKDENGLWEINEERVNDVIAARTRQLAVENAMSYVERLKLAAQEGSVESLNDLLFVTTDATNSTWGLVYAELELMHTMGDLNDSQYQAALHNIQAMQDLAENAVQNIGKATGAVAANLEETRKQLESTKDGLEDLLDELGDMQDGAGDLVNYVMDMLKHRIQQQIDLLEEMKDKYSEIIDLKKQSLDATKDEQNYQKTIAKKLKEMAKLQERINALSLDDSRSAQAEKAKLLEELAELQDDLDSTQADKSIEVTKDALDKMEEDYHAEKDEEIKILENSISSTQKLYDMAIEYIRNNWGTLYKELISWNTEYGSVLNSEITAAWEAAQAAAQRYGDFVSAIMGGISAEIDSITKQIEALDEQMSNLSTSSGSSGAGGAGTENRNTTVGNKTTHTSPSSEDMVRTIVGRMKEYGAVWNKNNDKATNDALHQKAADLAKQLDQYGVHAEFRDSDGTWWITQDELNRSNIGKLLHSCYHTGGFVGDEPLKPNERYIKAENGELVLTSDQQDSFAAQLDRISAMTDVLAGVMAFFRAPAVGGGLSQAEMGTINNITNNSRPIEINVGDTIIQGNASAETVAAHGKMTEKMVNDLARLVGVKW